MSSTYWAFEASTSHERLVSWLASFAGRRGDRFGAVGELTPSRDDVCWQIGAGHAPQWSRAIAPICCFPELVTSLSRELGARVITVSQQESIGLECFCVLDRGEIETLFTDCGDGVLEEEGIDRGWVERYLSSGLVRVPRGVGPQDYQTYIYAAFIHVGCDVDMKWAWSAALDFEPNYCMTASSFGSRFVGYDQERGWRATMALAPPRGG